MEFGPLMTQKDACMDFASLEFLILSDDFLPCFLCSHLLFYDDDFLGGGAWCWGLNLSAYMC